ncbi:cation diffusion facilitator family transporter [Abditibacterium utsteinense]|uniref:Cation diffusion facilitator family transporter n=1 Tax=Abditibacterium utsteinense TaxID=1960156 RepID=A0A2S8SVX0_9BACT|nr:cation diffusion facilitator family transporter [Abditibacterium utsteinense]PQV64933.1 cation diffusion facilitator family transporter [Abditibacterium utsteinense]
MTALSNLKFEAQQQAARLSLGANVFLVLIKVGAGLKSGSLSVLAEGVQSLLDIFASAMILWIVKAAAAPPDEAHPYGHGKFENLMALVQMTTVLGSILGIWYAAWTRFQNPVMPSVDWGVAAIIVSIGVNLWVSNRIFRVAQDTDSQALRAEGVHLRGDLWSCAGVLLGLIATRIFGNARLDPLFAAAMTIFAMVSALHLLRDTLRPLLDESLPGEEEREIKAVLEADTRVMGFHKLRTRQAGSARLADVHILLDDHLSFRAAHDIGEQIEDEIRRVLPNLDVMVHTEPFEAEIEHQREVHGRAAHQKGAERKRREAGG